MNSILRKIMGMALCAAMCMSCMCMGVSADDSEGKVIYGLDEKLDYLDYIQHENGKVFTLPKNDYESNKYGWYEADDKIIYTFDKETKEIHSVYCKYNHLDQFVIPENFTSISGQLYGLDKTEIDKIYIPKTVEDIQLVGLAYLHCGEYIVDEDNPNYCSINGAVYSKNGKALVAFPTTCKSEMYVMPEGVTSMWSMVLSNALNNSKNIKYFIFASTYDVQDYEVKQINNAINNSESQIKAVYYEGMPDRNEGKLVNAKEALRMAIGIEEMQLDLQEYVKNKNMSYLYDYDNDGKISLKDAKAALKIALGITK